MYILIPLKFVNIVHHWLFTITDFDKSEYVSFTCLPNNIRYTYRKEWFSNYLDIEFEQIHLQIPSGYNEYLKTEYRDYVVSPPIEKVQF